MLGRVDGGWSAVPGKVNESEIQEGSLAKNEEQKKKNEGHSVLKNRQEESLGGSVSTSGGRT